MLRSSQFKYNLIVHDDILTEYVGRPKVEHIKAKLHALCEGRTKEANADKKGSAHDIWGIRLNQKQRVLYKKIEISKNENYICAFEFNNHNYGTLSDKNALSSIDAEIEKIKVSLQKTKTLPPESKFKIVDLEAVNLSDAPKEEAAESAVRVYPYNGEYIELSDDQDKTLKVKAPAFVKGFAGSGKTLLALIHLFEKIENNLNDDQDPILFTTNSPYLIEHLRLMWEESDAGKRYAQKKLAREQEIAAALASGKEPPQPLREVVFTYYADLLANVLEKKDCVGKQPADIQDYYAWLQTNDYKNIKKPKNPTNALLTKVAQFYDEFRVMSGYDEKAYIKLNKDESIFKETSEREWLWRLYQTYLVYLDKNKKFDPNFVTFDNATPEEKARCKDSFSIIYGDECGLFSHAQANLLLYLAKNRNLFLFGDPQQTPYAISNEAYLSNMVKTHRGKVAKLIGTHRCPKIITDWSNGLLRIKFCLSNGKSIKEEDTQISISHKSIDIDHQIGLLNPKELGSYKNDLCLLFSKPNCAVLVLDPDLKEEAKDVLNPTYVLSIKDSQGKDFDEVVLYKVFSSPQLEKLNKHPALKELAKKSVEEIKAFFADEKPINRPNQKNEYNNEFDSVLRMLFTGFTRAKRTLLFCEEAETVENSVVFKLLQAIAAPHKGIPPHLQTSPKIPTVTALKNEKAGTKLSDTDSEVSTNSDSNTPEGSNSPEQTETPPLTIKMVPNKKKKRSKKNQQQQPQSNPQTKKAEKTAPPKTITLSSEQIKGWEKIIDDFIDERKLDEAYDCYRKWINPKISRADFNKWADSRTPHGTNFKIKQQPPKPLTPQEDFNKRLAESKARREIISLKTPSENQTYETRSVRAMAQAIDPEVNDYASACDALVEFLKLKNIRAHLFELSHLKIGTLFDSFLNAPNTTSCLATALSRLDEKSLAFLQASDLELWTIDYLLNSYENAEKIFNPDATHSFLATLLRLYKGLPVADHIKKSIFDIIFYKQAPYTLNKISPLNRIIFLSPFKPESEHDITMDKLSDELFASIEIDEQLCEKFSHHLQQECTFPLTVGNKITQLKVSNLFALILQPYFANFDMSINPCYSVSDFLTKYPALFKKLPPEILYTKIQTGPLKNLSLFSFLLAEPCFGHTLLRQLFITNPDLITVNDKSAIHLNNEEELSLFLLTTTYCGRAALLHLLNGNPELFEQVKLNDLLITYDTDYGFFSKLSSPSPQNQGQDQDQGQGTADYYFKTNPILCGFVGNAQSYEKFNTLPIGANCKKLQDEMRNRVTSKQIMDIIITPKLCSEKGPEVTQILGELMKMIMPKSSSEKKINVKTIMEEIYSKHLTPLLYLGLTQQGHEIIQTLIRNTSVENPDDNIEYIIPYDKWVAAHYNHFDEKLAQKYSREKLGELDISNLIERQPLVAMEIIKDVVQITHIKKHEESCSMLTNTLRATPSGPPEDSVTANINYLSTLKIDKLSPPLRFNLNMQQAGDSLKNLSHIKKIILSLDGFEQILDYLSRLLENPNNVNIESYKKIVEKIFQVLIYDEDAFCLTLRNVATSNKRNVVNFLSLAFNEQQNIQRFAQYLAGPHPHTLKLLSKNKTTNLNSFFIKEIGDDHRFGEGLHLHRYFLLGLHILLSQHPALIKFITPATLYGQIPEGSLKGFSLFFLLILADKPGNSILELLFKHNEKLTIARTAKELYLDSSTWGYTLWDMAKDPKTHGILKTIINSNEKMFTGIAFKNLCGNSKLDFSASSSIISRGFDLFCKNHELDSNFSNRADDNILYKLAMDPVGEQKLKRINMIADSALILNLLWSKDDEGTTVIDKLLNDQATKLPVHCNIDLRNKVYGEMITPLLFLLTSESGIKIFEKLKNYNKHWATLNAVKNLPETIVNKLPARTNKENFLHTLIRGSDGEHKEDIEKFINALHTCIVTAKKEPSLIKSQNLSSNATTFFTEKKIPTNDKRVLTKDEEEFIEHLQNYCGNNGIIASLQLSATNASALKALPETAPGDYNRAFRQVCVIANAHLFILFLAYQGKLPGFDITNKSDKGFTAHSLLQKQSTSEAANRLLGVLEEEIAKKEAVQSTISGELRAKV